MSPSPDDEGDIVRQEVETRLLFGDKTAVQYYLRTLGDMYAEVQSGCSAACLASMLTALVAGGDRWCMGGSGRYCMRSRLRMFGGGEVVVGVAGKSGVPRELVRPIVEEEEEEVVKGEEAHLFQHVVFFVEGPVPPTPMQEIPQHLHLLSSRRRSCRPGGGGGS